MTASAWEYAQASDRLLGEAPAAFVDRVSELMQVPAGAVFLRNQQQRLEIWWHDELAVVGHCDSEEGDLDCATTKMSLDQSDSLSSPDLIEWTCSCCGVSLGRFIRALHIRREAAFEILKHVIVYNRRPQTSIHGPIVWNPVDASPSAWARRRATSAWWATRSAASRRKCSGNAEMLKDE